MITTKNVIFIRVAGHAASFMEKKLSVYNLLLSWLRLNYKSLALAVLIAAVTFPEFALLYSAGIDESLPWVFNYLASGHHLLGINTLFPHGRLAFLLYPLPMGNNLWLTICMTCVCSVIFSLTMFKLYFLRHPKNYIVPALLLLIIHSVIDIQLLIIGITFSQVLLYHLLKKERSYFIAVFFCVFGLYVKAYCGIVCGLILVSQFFYTLYTDKNYKLGLKAVVVFFAVYYVFWLSLYATFANSLNYLIAQYQLSADNSGSVSLYNQHYWRFISLCLVCLVAMPLFSKDKLANHFFRIMLLSVFAVWKHAMSRSDVIHVSAFFYFLVFFLFSFILLMKEVRVRSIVLAIVSIGAFTLNMSTANYTDFRPGIVLKPGNLYNLVHNYNFISKEKTKEASRNTARLHLSDTILHTIGKATADVYPWNYAIIAANTLNWQPRPVIQSYAAYNSWLDQQDADHFLSEQSAQFYIWEINKTHDASIRSMESIDRRYLLNDEPKAMISFFSNYSLRYKNADYLLYEKRKHALAVTNTVILKQGLLNNDEWMDVPLCDDKCVMRAKFFVKKSPGGKLLSLVYKDEAFFIFYEFEDKTSRMNRIVAKNAGDGIWVYPYIASPTSDTIEQKVKRIRIMCSDDRMVDTEYKIEFEQIRFVFDTPGAGFLKEEFHKTISRN